MSGYADNWSGFATHDESEYAELWDNCVCAWNPGLGSSALTLRGFGNIQSDGNIQNTTSAAAWTVGRYGNQVSLDGSNDVIDFGTNDGIKPLTSLGYSFWVRLNTTTTAGNYMATFEQNNNPNYGMAPLIKTSGKLAVYCKQSATEVNYDGTGVHTLVANTWYHLAFTYSAAGMAGYVNGKLDALVTSGVTGAIGSASGSSLRFGDSVFSALYGNRAFNGVVTDLMMFSFLKEPQIALLALRPSIAYEPRQRRRRVSVTAAAGNRRRRVLIGAGI